MLRGSLLVVILTVSGCGGVTNGGAVTKVDIPAAQESLRQTLDGWKKGNKPEELAKRTPPISVTDLEWKSGTKLLDYEILSAEEPRGQGLLAVVNLKMSKRDGKTAETTAKYIVNRNEDSVNILRVKPKMR